MELRKLQEKYSNVPKELKILKRWICFKVEGMEDGRVTKRPYNPISGNFAKVNDRLTWGTFDIALSGCAKYNCDGLGFILGEGIFGIDLDNHPDKDGNKLSDEEFKSFAKIFIDKLDSYTEYSQSGEGIHIICQGELPKGGRRRGCVEMYDSGRFFAFTGNTIRNIPINERTEQVIPLWQEYINVFKPKLENREINTVKPLSLDDEDLIQVALSSKQGGKFYSYYHDGDISQDNNDQSAADMSFCNMLAWWTNCDEKQMDRIFRSSALMRDKWDEYRGEYTYGKITINKAISDCKGGYSPEYYNSLTVNANKNETHIVNEDGELISQVQDNLMNIDENGIPIFRIKKIFKKFRLTDTGNAERFYAYFGDLFKYNVTDKIFMFWTGKTWVRDTTDIVRKYADKMIDILLQEENELAEELNSTSKEEDAKKYNDLTLYLAAVIKNRTRFSNKAGKDAMLFEFRHLADIPIESKEFNKNDYLINTDSGVVDLRTGDIFPFDKQLLMSKNTNCKVSYEEPTEWLKFLRSVFNTGDIVKTEHIIESMQTCLGYSISGSTKEQVMFLLYGNGSNGKSTLVEQIATVMGDYAENIQNEILMSSKGATGSDMFSIAKLQGARFVHTGETEEGGKFAESKVKILTGGDTISAQFKFGNEFSFKPKYKIWMSTNNLPNIRGTDDGIWRRLFLFRFANSFTGANKDKSLPDKLYEERDKILGWCIQGFIKYFKKGELVHSEESEELKDKYRYNMDIVSQFIAKECSRAKDYKVDCKVLYSRFKEWFLNNTEYNMRESKFSESLKSKGIYEQKSVTDGRRYYVGIKLNGYNIVGQ